MKMWMPGLRGLVDRAQRRVDVFLAGAREADHGRPGDGLGDSMHRLEIAGRRSREAGLDDIDAEALELARDRELLLDVHGAAGRLLAVAQRGVEDADVVGVGQDVPDIGYRFGHRRLSLLRAFRDGRAARPRGGQKRKRPGRPFGPPPGAFGSGFKVASLSLHHDAPGEGLNKAQAKQQSQQQGQTRRHHVHCRRRSKAQSSGHSYSLHTQCHAQ